MLFKKLPCQHHAQIESMDTFARQERGDIEKCSIMRHEHKFGAEEKDEKEKELEERPLTIVPVTTSETAGGFDVCKEYGYKYEYAADDIQEDDVEERTSTPATSAANHSLHHTTAAITKSNELLPYIHLLGRTYHPVHNYHERKKYERSLYWFTYRCDFPAIHPYAIDSDAGWGCMLRSAQMLLGHTLRVHFKSRNWVPPPNLEDERRDDFVKKLLTWFADYPSKNESVYSLHNFVASGSAKYEVLPGEWWGPSQACYAMRDLVDLHQKTQPSMFRVHVSTEGTVYRDSIYKLMTRDSKKRATERMKAQESGMPPSPLHPLDPIASATDEIDISTLEWDTGLLLLVPLRLGLDKFNEDYVDCLAKSFWLPQSVGVLGGRPRGARWFYGAYADGSKALALDPHTVQQTPKRNALGNVQLSDDYLSSVHTGYPEVYPIHRMDPSIAAGFYCRDRKDFLALQESFNELKKASKSPSLFTFAERTPNYLISTMDDLMLDSATFEDDGVGAKNDDSDDEEYVFL